MRLTKLFFINRFAGERAPKMSDKKNLVLAPAAGAGIGKMLADALLAKSGFLDEMVEAASGGLTATSRRWDRDSDGWIVEPDFKTRLAALALLLAHMEGEPIKRIIHQHLGGEGRIDPQTALQDSPELQAALERALTNAKWRHSGKQAHKRPTPPEQVGELVPTAPSSF